MAMDESLYSALAHLDHDLWTAMQAEQGRQNHEIELIASENYTSLAVMEAQGSWLTNKYAEGYSGNRYYGGCEHVDTVENLAIDRLKHLFHAEAANVQPHSGSQANQAVFYTVLQPNDTVMGLSLADGGHLTHGAHVNISGQLFQSCAYGLDPVSELIDMDQVMLLAKKHRPRLLIAGASSYTRIIDWAAFRKVADEVGAYLMADIAHYAGLIAAGVYPSPLPFADFVTSTTHKTLRGPRGGLIMTKANLLPKVNKSVFPGMQGGPLMHVIAGKAVAFELALQPAFKTYQQQVLANAKAMEKVFQNEGIRLVSGGTDCHMLLIDTRTLNMTGQQAEEILKKIAVTLNKNVIPNDPEKPQVTSGIRIGTPAMTTRGLKEEEMMQVARWIVSALRCSDDDSLAEIRKNVAALCCDFPLYTR